jgi:pimeloyl-ACP methyl ester carboxylesterase
MAARSTSSRERVATPGGAELALYRSGDRSKPTVLLVHGFPDDHRVWEGVTTALATHHHVVSYDIRGSGSSAKPARVRDYRLDVLATDLQSVIDHVGQGRGVHLVGHDWGSVQGWHLITDPAHRGVLSFTSISGPCLDHVRGMLRLRARSGDWRAIAALWKSPLYMGLLQVPVLAHVLCRSGAVDLVIALSRRFECREFGHGQPPGSDAKANRASVRMYAANLLPRLVRGDYRGTHVPVQIVAPTADVFIPATSQVATHPEVRTKRVELIPGGHWAPAYQPVAIAGLIAGWAAQHQAQTNNHTESTCAAS